MINVSDPLYAGLVPTTFIAHGCYSYDSKGKADTDTESVAASKRVPRKIDVFLYKVTPSDPMGTKVGEKLNVSRTQCSSTQWRTSFTAPVLPSGESYRLVAIKTDTDGSTEPTDVSPFYVATNAVQQTEPQECLCAGTVELRPISFLRSDPLTGDADAGDRKGCCRPTPRGPYPTRYDGFAFYRPEMKHAICLVFDPRPGPTSKGIAGVTRAEFSMGHCAALVPIPADAGPVSYAYKFLILDATETLVLHQSQPRALA